MSAHKQDGLSFATLRAAEAVIETKSLTGAAAKLGISQPAISMHLGRLEKVIGTPLIKKIGNKIVVREEISEIIKKMIELEKQLRTIGFEKSISNMKVGLCSYCSPLAIHGFHRLGKLKEFITWRIADSKRLAELYERGELDAAFRALYPSELAPDLTTEFHLRWIGNRSIVEKVKQDLAPLPVVLASGDSPLGTAARNWLRQRDIAYDLVGEVDDIMTVLLMVVGGVAVAPLPSFTMERSGVELDDCTEVLPGRVDIRYGMFFDEKRFSLRSAEDIFELLKRGPARVDVTCVRFQRSSHSVQ